MHTPSRHMPRSEQSSGHSLYEQSGPTIPGGQFTSRLVSTPGNARITLVVILLWCVATGGGPPGAAPVPALGPSPPRIARNDGCWFTDHVLRPDPAGPSPCALYQGYSAPSGFGAPGGSGGPPGPPR